MVLKHRIRSIGIALCALLVLPVAAQADGDVIIRPATAQEKAFIVETIAMLKRAVTPPQGWDYALESPLVAEETLRFSGKREYPIEVKYQASMKLVAGLEERQAKYKQTLQETRPAKDKLESLMQVVRRKGFEGDKARQAGNREAFEKARQEMEAAQREYNDLAAQPGNPYQRENEAEFELRKDTSIRVTVAANAFSEQTSGALAPIEVPGATAAVRYDPADKTRQSTALVLFGDWQLQKFGEGANQALVARRTPSQGDALTKVFNVAVELEADRQRLDSLLTALDSTGFPRN